MTPCGDILFEGLPIGSSLRQLAAIKFNPYPVTLKLPRGCQEQLRGKTGQATFDCLVNASAKGCNATTRTHQTPLSNSGLFRG